LAGIAQPAVARNHGDNVLWIGHLIGIILSQLGPEEGVTT